MSRVGVLGPLETDRLVLRPGSAGDAEVFHQLWGERDPRVPAHRRIGADGRPTVQDIARQIERDADGASGPRLLTVVRKVEDDVIGYCGLLAGGHGSPEEPELAYELLRRVHGRGYATEAAAAVVGWAAGTGYGRLCAGVWDWNVASRRVLDKLGFREVGRVEPHSEHGHSLLTVRDPLTSSVTEPLPAARNSSPPDRVRSSMTTIGFIGSGKIGSTVARLAVDAGDEVVLSNSRGPETLADLVEGLGPRARAATGAEAAAAGDIVVLTIPLGRLDEVAAEPLAGKVVIDTCNYYPQRDGQIAALDDGDTTTSGLVQQHLGASHVVKAFNNIYFEHLASMGRPAGAEDRSTLMIAGDDAAAKQTVSTFLDTLGYDVLDTGSLADSWRFQRDQPAYAGAYTRDGDFAHAQPADAAHLQALLDQADPDLR